MNRKTMYKKNYSKDLFFETKQLKNLPIEKMKKPNQAPTSSSLYVVDLYEDDWKKYIVLNHVPKFRPFFHVCEMGQQNGSYSTLFQVVKINAFTHTSRTFL
jgi:hypothetical protein